MKPFFAKNLYISSQVKLTGLSVFGKVYLLTISMKKHFVCCYYAGLLKDYL